MVFVGEQEVCRGGVPAPAPPTEGSNWAYDLWSSEAVAAAAAAGGEGGGSSGGSGGGGGGKGGSGRARGAEVRFVVDAGRWMLSLPPVWVWVWWLLCSLSGVSRDTRRSTRSSDFSAKF